jgi:hypothetical protein
VHQIQARQAEMQQLDGSKGPSGNVAKPMCKGMKSVDKGERCEERKQRKQRSGRKGHDNREETASVGERGWIYHLSCEC